MQWIAEIAGANGERTTGVLDLDIVDDHYEGALVILQANRPMLHAFLRTSNVGEEHAYSIDLRPVVPGTSVFANEEQIAHFYKDGFDGRADIGFRIGKKHLKFSWEAPSGRGQVTVPNSRAGARSDYRGQRSARTWPKFKEFCESLPKGRFIFRGQARDWRLRTAFHRSGRSDTTRYLVKDLPAAHRALSGHTRHLFDRSVPEQNAAFLNLLQHHGYPTPLLDWSDSPFIAAYFAFEQRRRDTEEDGPVRILCFDRDAWMEDFPQMQQLAMVGPHVSILEALHIENPRAAPQQALSSVTNVDDIETYLRNREMQRGRSYLRVFDLPYAARGPALRDLSMMGITAGSLFPGIDGTCRALKAQFFGVTE